MNQYGFFLQIKELTLASLKSRYRKTLAGFLWVILNPLLMFGVQSLVFRYILKIDIPHYFLFLIGGLLPWIFMTTTIQMGTPLFVSQSHLLRSFKINPWVILGAQVVDSFINFLASFFLILIPFFLVSEKPFYHLFLIPLACIPLLLGTLAMTVILSILNVFYRDINFVIGFLFSILFFLTPVFYPKNFVPSHLEWIIDLNPVVYFIDPFRVIIYDSDPSSFFISLTKGLSLSLIFAGISVVLWKRKQNEFYRIL